MLYEPIQPDANPAQLAEELDRARRISLSLLGDTRDFHTLQLYIAELEARLLTQPRPVPPHQSSSQPGAGRF